MLSNKIPDQMTAVVLDSYTGVDALRIEKRPVPQPGPNQVLVKVDATPINPSDLAFLEGFYGFKKPTPVVPGYGTVLEGARSRARSPGTGLPASPSRDGGGSHGTIPDRARRRGSCRGYRPRRGVRHARARSVRVPRAHRLGGWRRPKTSEIRRSPSGFPRSSMP